MPSCHATRLLQLTPASQLIAAVRVVAASASLFPLLCGQFAHRALVGAHERCPEYAVEIVGHALHRLAVKRLIGLPPAAPLPPGRRARRPAAPPPFHLGGCQAG